MGDRNYEVTTMGMLGSFKTRNPFDDGESMGDLPMAASEGGNSDTELGPSVGIATANPIPSPLSGGNLVDLFNRGGGGPVTPAKPAAPRVTPQSPSAAAPGLFGDLFGAHTDVVVIAGGLLLLAGLAYLVLSKPAPAGKKKRAA